MTAIRRTLGVASRALRHAWRLIILVVGLTVVGIGVAMIVLPGPAVVVIPVGLAILSTEFVWARHLLRTLKERANGLVNGITSTNSAPTTPRAELDQPRPAAARDATYATPPSNQRGAAAPSD